MGEAATQVLSRSDAERLTEKLRHTATTFVEARDKLTELIRQAQEGKAHEALGFRSWTEYVAQVFSDTPLMRLTRDQRRELVGELAEQGMSTRAIAPVVGASFKTVARDIQESVSVDTDEPRVVQSQDGIERTFQPKSEPSGNFWTEPEDEPYQMPTAGETPAPKRRALPQQFLNAIVELRKATERFERLMEDDRLPKYKKEVADLYASDLNRASDTLTKISDALTH